MAADGSLKFDTKIDTSDFDASISTLEKALDRLRKSVDKLSSDLIMAFNGSGSAAVDMGGRAQETAQDIDEITESAQRAEEQTADLKKELEDIKVSYSEDEETSPIPERSEAINNSGMYGYDAKAMAAVFGEEAAEIRNYAEAVSKYGSQASATLNNMSQEAKGAEEAFQGIGDEGTSVKEAQISNQKIVDLFHSLERLKARQKELETAGMGLGYQEYDANAAQIARITAKLKEYQDQLQSSGEKSSVFARIVKSAFSLASKAVGNFAKTLGNNLTSKAKQAVTSLNSLKKPSDRAGKSILKLSNMFKLMLIRMAMSAAIQGAKEGMQNLVQYSDAANQSVSGLMSGMTYLENSFAAAFAPILSFVAPALNTLINLLATAVGYINQFFSALGGGSTFIRAKKVNEDYAKSLKSTGGAAKQAGKDAKKALAPFDDLIQMQRQSNSDTSGGGGVSPANMFETVGIDKGISDFANKLKELFDAGNWGGIGRLIGEKINEAVQSFTEYISWENVGGKITAFVTAFTTMFNSLVATIDWYAIGIMMGTGINTLANTLYLLLTQIDWFMLGNAFSQGLMGMVNTVDWELFGATIGAYFQAKISGLFGFVIGADWGAIGVAFAVCLMGLANQINWEQLGYLLAAGLNAAFRVMGEFAHTFDWADFGNKIASSLSTFFQTFQWAEAGTAINDMVIGILDALITVTTQTDWWAFGEGVAAAIEHIDWAAVATRFFTAIGAAFGGFAAFLGGLISDGVTAAQQYFQGKIEECGGNIGLGILKGILNALGSLYIWICKNILDPFVNGFKQAFGIHSPSTVMAEMGQYLWEGFCNGIKEFFSNPGDFIRANITDPFVNKLKDLLGIHSPSTVMAGIGSYTVQGFNQGITNEQTASQNVIRSWASGVASWFKDKFGISTGDSAESKQWAANILSGFNSSITKNYVKSQSVMEIWAESIRKWFVGADENQGVNELSWTKFADLIIQAFKSKIESSFAETQEPMETWAKNVKEWFWGDSNMEGTGGMYAAFYNMAKRINEGFAQGISDFAYMAKAAIRQWAREAMEEAEEEFDINSPSKEFYSIAEYVVRGFNEGITDLASSSVKAARSWLDGVLDVFEGVNVKLPIGIRIPNAASYLPRMATGSIVPYGAGETASNIRRVSGYGQEDALEYLISRIDEMIGRLQTEGERPIQIVLNLTGNLAALARVLKPELDKEAARRGVSLVVIGGS